MIVTILEGGLGNMLFQLCFTITQSKKYGADFYFLNYENNCQDIHYRHNANSEVYHTTIFRNIPLQSPPVLTIPQIMPTCPFEYSEIAYEPGCYNIYKGYFQSEKYFEDSSAVLKELLVPSEAVVLNIKQRYEYLFEEDCVSLHIRRGDYLHLGDHHPVLPLSYYHESLEAFPEATKIVVFTNDIPWCQEVFKDSRFVFIREPDWYSLYMMSFCPNHIVANSSFSWWGAKLAEWNFGNENTKVFRPNPWFGPEVKHNLCDLVPERWQKVEVSK